MGPRIRTVVSLEGAALRGVRGEVPRILGRLRREVRVVAADAAWEAGGSRLLLTVEAEVDGEATDADEAENFHRVWRCAIRCLGDAAADLRIDLEGSIGLPGDEPPGR